MIAWILEKPVRWIVGGAIVFGLIGLTVHSCATGRQDSANATYSDNREKSAVDSGKDAVGTVGAANAREGQIENEVKHGIEDIRNAPAGDSNAAADRAACGMRSYRRSRRCVELLGPPPG